MLLNIVRDISFAPVESVELLGDFHPLVRQLGAIGSVVALNVAQEMLRLHKVRSVAGLRRVIARHRRHLLLPTELPAIYRTYLHATSQQTRELIAFDRSLSRHELLRPLAEASRQVGREHLQRLRPLRGERVVRRYLQAVDDGRAHGWHMLVYGLSLAVYSLPVLQGLLSYQRQTVLALVHLAAIRLELSDAACRELVEELAPTTPDFLQYLEPGTQPMALRPVQ